jgi:hypothetical protein
VGRIKKVVFLIESYFNKRDYERFGIETLERNGFEVQVWDFTPIITSPEFGKVRPPDPIQWDKLFIFETRKKAVDALLGLDESVYIVSLIRCFSKTFYLYRVLKKKKIPYCVLGNSTPKSTKKIEVLAKQFRSVTFNKIIRKIIECKAIQNHFVSPADMVVAPGERLLPFPYVVDKDSKILWAHGFDYDVYMKIKDLPSVSDSKSLVFLDMYFPYHPDFVKYGIKLNADPGEYHMSICRFFEYLEREFGVKIVIAAHPRSHYEKHGDCFGGRKVIRGRTAELVKDSGLVIAHNSIAIDYAVLFKKPIMFITTNAFDASRIEDPSVAWLADYFGRKVHNLDSSFAVNISEEMRTNEQAYRRYKNDYIKREGSAELPFWQIVSERLMQS